MITPTENEGTTQRHHSEPPSATPHRRRRPITAGLTHLLAVPRHWGRRVQVSLRSHPLLWSVLIAAGLSVLVAIPLTPVLLGNDDAAIVATLDGSYYGRPQPHTVYANVVVGLALSSLYAAAGSIPWYGIYLYFAYFVGLTAVVYVVLADDRSGFGRRVLALAGYMAVFALWMGTQITFTSVALMLGFAGVLLYLSRGPLPRTSWVAMAGAGVMVGAASLVRWHTLGAVLVLAVPLVLLAARRIPWRRQALFVAVAAGVVLSGCAFQAAYYAGKPEWRDYFEFNAVRSAVRDSPTIDAAGAPEVLDAVGWSENDLAMFRNWFYLDQDVYGVEQLRQVNDATGWPLTSLGLAAGSLRVQTAYGGVMGLILTTALLTAAWAFGGRATRRFSALAVAYTATVLAGLALLAKLPPTVGIPILAFLALLLLTTPAGVAADAGGREGGRWRRVTAWVLAGAAIAAVVAGVSDAALGRDSRRVADQTAIAPLREIQQPDPGGIFIQWGNELLLGFASPWRAPLLPSFLGIPLGWPQRSPVHSQWMAELGIDDLYLAIGSREDVYLPLRPPFSLGALYLTYLEEHYGFSGLLRPRAEQDTFTIFDLAVAYALDDRARTINERRPDGTEVRYPLVDDRIVGGARLRTVDDHVRVTGWAADLDSLGPVDYIVVFDDDRAVSVSLPADTPLTQRAIRYAERLGVADPHHLGFEIAITATPHTNIRIFALSDGRAAEITP